MFYDKHGAGAAPYRGSGVTTFDTAASVADPVLRASRRDDRRRILEAMIETVASRGYDRTTLTRVLQSAQVSEGVFDEHFSDKSDCFMQALEDLIGGAEIVAIDLFHEPTAWPEQVRIALQRLLRALARNPGAARVAFVEVLSAGPHAHERHRSALALFTALIERGRSMSMSTDHLPPQTSEAIVGGIVEILRRRVLEGDIAELPALHKDLTYFALLPYLEHERAATVAELPVAV
jgi:AcrR family transcriptional regulator